MKIHFEHKSTIVEFESRPMPPERFTTVCRLAGRIIAGAVLLAAIHVVGIWAIVWAGGVLVLVGLYRLAREGFK